MEIASFDRLSRLGKAFVVMTVSFLLAACETDTTAAETAAVPEATTEKEVATTDHAYGY